MLLSRCILGLALAALVPAAARARCTLSTETLAFGNFPSGEEARGVAKIVARCDRAGGVKVVATESGGSRRLNGPSDDLRYQLFIDPGHQLPFGDGGGSSQALTGYAEPGDPLEWRIYGRLAAEQRVRAGTYADTIALTLIPD